MKEFEIWWREIGQFIPPLDKVHDHETLAIFKKVAQGLYIDLEEEYDKVVYELDEAMKKLEP